MRTRMYGGVRGRKTKVGRKLTLFSSYSIWSYPGLLMAPAYGGVMMQFSVGEIASFFLIYRHLCNFAIFSGYYNTLLCQIF